MARFDLELLHALVVIAEAGSLTAAAPRLCRSQSAVSEQVRKLEAFCGVPLLVRGKTGARLTPAGERLVAHARPLLAASDAALQEMRGTRLAGDLRLAITDYFRPAAVAAFLKHLGAEYPRLRLHVSIRKSAVIEQEVGNGDFDIGLTMRYLDGSPPPNDGRILLGREPLVWIAHPAFAAGPSDCLPLIVLPDHCSLQQQVVRVLDRHGIRYDVVHSATGVGGLQMALSAGLGVACLNPSATPADVAPFDWNGRLPPMPDVEFGLLPARAAEPPLVAEVRQMLARHLADPSLASPAATPSAAARAA
ncbi:LysR family transcriptional regulator [Stella humosa]|uniref:LysR family transcriptional regulator n=1 Tax=Stella humosa TaxID=94 RepID=A0A3N1LYD8_9PROT|nr:LysR family transcriptional regulator [Stella humosa]ROQ00234.1 LysR family transcriptional regulator [Stella humosa]BBK30530.1 LysR family transcriptional regulator [Stella humosa]